MSACYLTTWLFQGCKKLQASYFAWWYPSCRASHSSSVVRLGLGCLLPLQVVVFCHLYCVCVCVWQRLYFGTWNVMKWALLPVPAPVWLQIELFLGCAHVEEGRLVQGWCDDMGASLHHPALGSWLPGVLQSHTKVGVSSWAVLCPLSILKSLSPKTWWCTPKKGSLSCLREKFKMQSDLQELLVGHIKQICPLLWLQSSKQRSGLVSSDCNRSSLH